MGDEEYYFDDQEGGDDGDDGEVTWETEVENTYADAKGMMDSDPAGAIRKFHDVISTDQDHGRWTFKAYKWIARTCVKHKTEDRVPSDYQKAMEYNYSGKTKQDTEKFIGKFFDRSGNLSQGCLRECANRTLSFLAKDMKGLEKTWFTVKYRLAQMNLAESELGALEDDVKQLHEWCGDGPAAEERRGTQKLMTYALEIQLRTILNDQPAVRALYTRAMSISSAIPPPRIIGIIRESGGKIFMRQGLWAEAYEAFFQAFRSFDEVGDPRRISNLKYLFVATMLSSRKINPFDAPETRSYQNDPEIMAMVDLIAASTRNDVAGFFKVLNDKKNAKGIKEDAFLFSYIEPLIKKVQCQAIAQLVKPYASVKIESVAQQVMLTTKEAELLIFSMILSGQISASIDQQRGVLLVASSKGTTASAQPAAAAAAARPGAKTAATAAVVANRYATLGSIAQHQSQLQGAVFAKIG